MTWNYLTRNLGDVPAAAAIVIGLLIAVMVILLTLQVPGENRAKALRYAATALLYFLLVLIVMNSLKTIWGQNEIP